MNCSFMNIAPSFDENVPSGTPAKRHVTTPMSGSRKRRRHGAHVVGIDARVAVGQDQHLVAHEPHHREHVRDLGVTRAGHFADVDIDIPIGKRRRDALRDRQRGIVGARDAEDELKIRIVLLRERAQVLLETGFGAVQRHEQA